jgi:hypothetical protein
MRMATFILASGAAAGALAFAAPALAGGQPSPAPETNSVTPNGGDASSERVIILSDRLRDHGQADAGSDHRRLRVFGLDGANAGCADHPLVDRATPDGQQRTRVIVCERRELSAAERSTQLEHVMDRIQHMDGLSDTSKERVTAALREAIDQLRNTH